MNQAFCAAIVHYVTEQADAGERIDGDVLQRIARDHHADPKEAEHAGDLVLVLSTLATAIARIEINDFERSRRLELDERR